MMQSLYLSLFPVLFNLASSQLAAENHVLDYQLQTEILRASFQVNHLMQQQDGGVFTGTTASDWNDASVQDQSVDNISQQCQEDFVQYESDLKQGKTYALLMFDATAKPPSGILQGNVIWPGSWSECKNITRESFNITFGAKYYMVHVALKVKIPYGKSLKLGVCVPSSCSSRDVTIKLKRSMFFRALVERRIIKKSVSTKPIEYQPIQNTTIAAICICSCIALLLLLGTMYDVMIHQTRQTAMEDTHEECAVTHGKGDEVTQNSGFSGQAVLINTAPMEMETIREGGMVGQVLLCFSLYTNIEKLLSTKQAPGTIRCLHGIRFLSMSWVILGHTQEFVTKFVDNNSATIEIQRDFTFQAVVQARVCVDSFFLLSGILMSYLLLKQIQQSRDKGKPLLYGMIYLHRYLRLTPTYLFVMMLYMWVYPYLFRGPLSPSAAVDPNCGPYWWTNMLYINNLAHADTMCMGWSWYLANDMQFFIIGVPLVYILSRWRRLGFSLKLILLLASFITTAVLNLKLRGYELDLHHATYVKPYCRIGPYLVGVAVGWLLFTTKGKIYKSMRVKVLAAVCWAVATASALAVVYGLYGTFYGTVLTDSVFAFYKTVSRTVWGLALGWVVIACYHGFGGVLDTILSWSVFVPLSRLTYCAYLVQQLVVFFYYKSKEMPVHYTTLTMMYIFLGNLIISYGLAFLVSVAVEVPLMRLEKLVFKQ